MANRSAAADFARTFGGGMSAGAPPAPAPGVCDADRTVIAGGALVDLLLHPSVRPYQQTFRALPSDQIHRATRGRPYEFVLGSFTVGMNQALALCEYRFRPYRFDGMIAGDAIPLEDRRLSTDIGYDLMISANERPGNVSAQIIPGFANPNVNLQYPPIQTGGTVTQSSLPASRGEAVQSLYGNAILPSNTGFAAGLQPAPLNARQFVTTLSGGASVMPQNQDGQQGPEKLPFTYYVASGRAVALKVCVFSPVRIPIAFFEGTLSGYILPQTTLDKMLEAVRPCA